MLDVAIVFCGIMLAWHSQQYVLFGLLIFVTILWLIECWWDIHKASRREERIVGNDPSGMPPQE